ncbi:MAG: gliding motility-associated C-terminal domain-containing protein [Flavobacteriales bacterium]|nr:gliding motility-associated C-terminal domain-containing protein [Flavobacteriales bacterium]
MRLSAVFFFALFCGPCFGQAYFLNGNATAQGDGCYSITPSMSWQNGTVWYSDQLNLNENFTLEFLMNFGSIDSDGADGMVFVLQTVGTSAIGVNGAGMGFQGFNPSFGIEFDTFNNSESGDLVSDHVAFLRDGVVDHNASQNLAGPVSASSTTSNIEDGNDHIIRIVWNAVSYSMELYVDCNLRLSLQQNLVTSIFGNNANVYWGFTGATGYYYNLQTVCLQEFFYHNVEDQAICLGESASLAASGNPFGSFSWFPATGLDDPLSQTPWANPTETTTYCCTYTDLCNQQTETCIEVVVEEEPVVFAGNDTVICSGDIAMLQASCDVSGVTYNWSSLEGNFLSGENSPNPSVNETGIYSVTTTTPWANCSYTDEVELTVWDLPVMNTGNPHEICPDGSLWLTAEVDDESVLWFNGSENTSVEVTVAGMYGIDVSNEYCTEHFEFEVVEVEIADINLGPDVQACSDEEVSLNAGVVASWSTGENAMEVLAAISGEYIATVFLGDCSTSDTILVSFVEPPSIDLGPDLWLCEGERDTIFSDHVGMWSDGTVADHYVFGETEGLFWILVTDGPCISGDSIHVELTPIPDVDFGADIFTCLGESIALTAPSADSGEILWSDLSNASTLNIHETGEYWLNLSNECGSDADTVVVSFEECDFLIYAPNAFTPDDDGINDVFEIFTMNLTHVEFSIYDRYGEEIFHAQDEDLFWDGSVRGGEYYAMNGIYNWQIRYTTSRLEAGERRGFVMLIR